MQCLEFELRDIAWIYIGNHDGRLTRGTVVHIFQLSWGPCQYVIEVDTHIDPILEVRDGFAMSDAEDKPIGLWRKNVREP